MNIIADGGFESPPATAGGFTSYNGGTSLGPWRVLNGGVDQYGAGFVNTVEGSQAVELNLLNPGGVEQTLLTTPGQTYTVSYLLSGFPGYQPGDGGPAVKTGEVLINGQAADTFSFDVTGKSMTNMGWVRREFTFVANSSSTTVSFVSTTPGNYGPAIDDVQVRADCSTTPSQQPIDPASCNALTRTGQGLLVPRTDYTGLTGGRPPAIGTERSVDIDVRVDGDCPRNVTIGARLTPVFGEAVSPGVDVSPVPVDQWTAVPGAQVSLDEPGVYEVTAVIRGQFNSPAGVDTDAWMTGRLFNVTTGQELPNTETLIIYRRETQVPAIGTTATTFAYVTVTSPTVIRVEVVKRLLRGRFLNAYVWSDREGRTKIGYKKIND
ncbi:choice-of-anchor C family protein [Streptomyces lavendofoliae]|uniref:choice-of-anchor C family protein n=1 Tax=Streptomyces lavendofoliae TaxID=67314 RepID=UPI00300F67EE